MGTRRLSSVAALAGSLLVAGSAAGEGPRPPLTDPGGPPPERRAVDRPEESGRRPAGPHAKRRGPPETRKRWEELDPGKRRAIEQLYRRLESLPPEKRARLLERLRGMQPKERARAIRQAEREAKLPPLERQAREHRRELLERLWKSLPPERRRELETMPPDARRRELEAIRRARREKLLDELPPELREATRRLPSGEQARVLRQYRARKTLERTFTPREIEALESLPRPELRGLLHRRGPAAETSPRARAPELPPPRPSFLADESWRRWLALRPFEQVRVLRLLEGARPHRRDGADSRGDAGRRRPRPFPDAGPRQGRPAGTGA